MPGITAATSHTSASAPAATSAKRPWVAADPVLEKHKAAARKSGLQRSLVELETLAGTTTRRLDDTYYSVLEKLGTLQSTIAALKELAELHRQLSTSFSKDADEIVADVGSQLDSFGQFEDQQQLIESLQDRIHTGRENIKSLSERVDVVRLHIENWERADREWQERTRKRLKAVWVISSVIALLVLLIFMTAQYGPENLEGINTRLTHSGMKTLKNAVATIPSNGGQQEIKRPNLTEPSETSSLANDALRTFDEL